MLEFEGLKISLTDNTWAKKGGLDQWGMWLPISYAAKPKTLDQILKKLRFLKEHDTVDEVILGEASYDLLKDYLTPSYEDLDKALDILCEVAGIGGRTLRSEFGVGIYEKDPKELKQIIIDKVKGNK